MSTGVEMSRSETFAYLATRSGRVCVYCDTPDDLVIDLVYPSVLGGSNRVTNMVLACRSCDRRKGANLVGSFVTDPDRLARIILAGVES